MDLGRVLTEAQRAVQTQVERARVFACRTILEGGSPSATVDYHALCILLRHLSTRDVAFLRRSLGSTTIDLDEVRAGSEPSFFGRMLWAMALDRHWSGPTLRQAEYVAAGRSFKMELDLACAPE